MLRVVVAIQCWGAAADRLHGRSISDFARHAFQGLDPASAEAIQFDRFVAIALLLMGLLVLVRPAWVALLAVLGWFTVQAVGALTAADGTTNWIVPAEQLVRIMAPLSLALIDWWPPKLKFSLGRFLFAMGLLRIAATVSIAAGGVSMLISGGDPSRLLPLAKKALVMIGSADPSDATAGMAMGLIGGIDLGMALSLIATRSRGVAVLVGLWSVWRICLWTLAYGPQGYSETLLRVAQAGAPLAMAAFSYLAVKEAPPQILPAGEQRRAA
jgi:hypothetical protein